MKISDIEPVDTLRNFAERRLLSEYRMHYSVPFLLFHLSVRQCKIWNSGLEYRGNISTTTNNSECLPWLYMESLGAVNMYHFDEEMVDEQHNMCRNPGGLREAPWCFISESRWEYCDIPICGWYTMV